jgi:hypothetical protein
MPAHFLQENVFRYTPGFQVIKQAGAFELVIQAGEILYSQIGEGFVCTLVIDIEDYATQVKNNMLNTLHAHLKYLQSCKLKLYFRNVPAHVMKQLLRFFLFLFNSNPLRELALRCNYLLCRNRPAAHRFFSYARYRYFPAAMLLLACNADTSRINRVKRGSLLARQYCSSCHAFPEPRLLDRITWEKDVLPAMGERLGINSFHGSYYRRPALSDTPGAMANRISMADWDQLVAYYTSVAPWQPLPQERPQPVKSPAPPLFTLRELPAHMDNAPLVSYVGIDTLKQRIWVADGEDSILHIYNNRLQLLQQLPTASIVSDVVLPRAFTNGLAYLTCLGTLYPSDALRGCIQTLQPVPGSGKGRGQQRGLGKDSVTQLVDKGSMQPADTLQLLPGVLKDRLPRPVATLPADFNQDGHADLLVCGFGYNNGALSWLELDSTGQKAVQEHVLFPRAGAIKAYIRDDNRDGRPDIWVLFAQGDESIWYFENTGKGHFEPHRVLQFPPVYGSSSFALQDVDHDGLEDIIYTCGDNADHSRVLKAYHGVYIYRNKGHRQFEQQYFYPVNGCYKAIVKDFDLDGDDDLLTISFFADYGYQPQEALLYFENRGNFNYAVYTLPASRLGHWICMDAGDIDGDGDADVVIGNFSQGPANFPGMGSQWRNGPPFIVLENNTRRARKKQ